MQNSTKLKNLKKLVDIHENLLDIIMEEISSLPSFGEFCDCSEPVTTDDTTDTHLRMYCLRCGGNVRSTDYFSRGDLY